MSNILGTKFNVIGPSTATVAELDNTFDMPVVIKTTTTSLKKGTDSINPPKKYNGSCLDGRDITYNIVPDADFKFYVTANLKTRATRRYKELKGLKKKVTYEEVLKSIKNRDKSDLERKISPLKRTKKI